jgi:hypothetical protein
VSLCRFRAPLAVYVRVNSATNYISYTRIVDVEARIGTVAVTWGYKTVLVNLIATKRTRRKTDDRFHSSIHALCLWGRRQTCWWDNGGAIGIPFGQYRHDGCVSALTELRTTGGGADR